MALTPSRRDREMEKFGETSTGKAGIRAIIEGLNPSGDLLGYTLEAGITAEPAGIQGDVPLTKTMNIIETVGTANDSATLASTPDDSFSYVQIVVNDSDKVAKLFPALGNNAGAGLNLGVLVGPGSITKFNSISLTEWKVG